MIEADSRRNTSVFPDSFDGEMAELCETASPVGSESATHTDSQGHAGEIKFSFVASEATNAGPRRIAGQVALRSELAVRFNSVLGQQQTIQSGERACPARSRIRLDQFYLDGDGVVDWFNNPCIHRYDG